MASVNRSALIVRPKQPFVDWINAVEPTSPVTLKTACNEPSVYLLPECDTEKDLANVLRVVYGEIFEDELWSWYTDPGCWPKDRSFAVFRRWFDWQWHSMVVDLSCDPLAREEE
jgi:hypothetical protein